MKIVNDDPLNYLMQTKMQIIFAIPYGTHSDNSSNVAKMLASRSLIDGPSPTVWRHGVYFLGIEFNEEDGPLLFTLENLIDGVKKMKSRIEEFRYYGHSQEVVILADWPIVGNGFRSLSFNDIAGVLGPMLDDDFTLLKTGGTV